MIGYQVTFQETLRNSISSINGDEGINQRGSGRVWSYFLSQLFVSTPFTYTESTTGRALRRGRVLSRSGCNTPKRSLCTCWRKNNSTGHCKHLEHSISSQILPISNIVVMGTRCNPKLWRILPLHVSPCRLSRPTRHAMSRFHPHAHYVRTPDHMQAI